MLSTATASAPRTSRSCGSPVNGRHRSGVDRRAVGDDLAERPGRVDHGRGPHVDARAGRDVDEHRPGRRIVGDHEDPVGARARRARTARARPGGRRRRRGRCGTAAVRRRGRRRRSARPRRPARRPRRCRPAARPRRARARRGPSAPDGEDGAEERAGGRRPPELLEDDGHLGERGPGAAVLLGHLEPRPPGLRPAAASPRPAGSPPVTSGLVGASRSRATARSSSWNSASSLVVAPLMAPTAREAGRGRARR